MADHTPHGSHKKKGKKKQSEKNKKISAKISLLVREGKAQNVAVAIANSMYERGEL